MEPDVFFGKKPSCRLREALKAAANIAQNADDNVDVVVIPPEPSEETDKEEGDDDCMGSAPVKNVSGEENCFLFAEHFLVARCRASVSALALTTPPLCVLGSSRTSWQQASPFVQNSVKAFLLGFRMAFLMHSAFLIFGIGKH